MLIGSTCQIACTAEANPALTESERSALERCVADFDSDDYQAREDAQKRMQAMGPRIQNFLETRLNELRGLDHAPAEVVARLKAALRNVEQLEVDRILGNLDLAVDRAPQLYLPPDPGTQKLLAAENIRFEWTDTPVRDVLLYLSFQTRVPIAIDPRIEGESSAEASINLRVADLKSDVVLNWVLKLADLEAVVRGKVVVITNADRAAKLRLQARIISLPVAPGDSPWTLDETRALAELTRDWPLRREPGINGAWSSDPPELCEATEAGKILVHGEASKLDSVESFFKAAGGPPQPPGPLPDWMAVLDDTLQTKASIEFTETALNESVKALNAQLGEALIFHPRCAGDDIEKAPVTIAMQEQPAREIVSALCKKCGVSAVPENGRLVLAKTSEANLHAAPQILDVRDALDAGISPATLKSSLDGLLEEARLPAASHIIRGRWLALADAWTVQRAAKLIAQSTAQKSIAARPAPPWFFATLAK